MIRLPLYSGLKGVSRKRSAYAPSHSGSSLARGWRAGFCRFSPSSFAILPLMEGRQGGSAEKLARLRAELARRGAQGFIVPRADEHQGEYVPPSADRLAWLTGFTGSAGLAGGVAGKSLLFRRGWHPP